jgi:cobalt/nickel transport system permease protein
MFDIFSDIFARRDNMFTRMDARAKMIIACALVIAVISSGHVFMPFVALAVCILTMLFLRIPARLLVLRLAAPLGIVIVLVLLKTFLTEGAAFFSVNVAGKEVAASREGFSQGILIASRVLGSVSVILLLGAVTPAYKIFHGLRWFGVPEGWVEIALLIYRYTFALLDQTADVAAAQSARLGYSSARRSISSVGMLAGTVIARSVDQAMRTYEAMTLRGYQGSFRFGPLPQMSRVDICAVVVAMPVIAASYAILEWWPW